MQQSGASASSPAQFLSFSSKSFEDTFRFHILLITVILHIQVHLPASRQPAQLCGDFPAKRGSEGICLKKQIRKTLKAGSGAAKNLWNFMHS